MEKMGLKAHANVIQPKYKYDDRLKIFREVEPPPVSLYLAIGFNQTPEDTKKHYRRYYPDELENIDDVVGRKPFKRIRD